jgi:hypothetical protein
MTACPTCETCRWFHRFVGGRDELGMDGSCQIRSATVWTSRAASGTEYVYFFPPRKTNAWCGEHAAKEPLDARP